MPPHRAATRSAPARAASSSNGPAGFHEPVGVLFDVGQDVGRRGRHLQVAQPVEQRVLLVLEGSLQFPRQGGLEPAGDRVAPPEELLVSVCLFWAGAMHRCPRPRPPGPRPARRPRRRLVGRRGRGLPRSRPRRLIAGHVATGGAGPSCWSRVLPRRCRGLGPAGPDPGEQPLHVVRPGGFGAGRASGAAPSSAPGPLPGGVCGPAVAPPAGLRRAVSAGPGASSWRRILTLSMASSGATMARDCPSSLPLSLASSAGRPFLANWRPARRRKLTVTDVPGAPRTPARRAQHRRTEHRRIRTLTMAPSRGDSGPRPRCSEYRWPSTERPVPDGPAPRRAPQWLSVP